MTLLITTALSAAHVVTVTLPPWLLAACYAVVGWSIGFRFTRPILGYAARQLPRIVASIVTLIGSAAASPMPCTLSWERTR